MAPFLTVMAELALTCGASLAVAGMEFCSSFSQGVSRDRALRDRALREFPSVQNPVSVSVEKTESFLFQEESVSVEKMESFLVQEEAVTVTESPDLEINLETIYELTSIFEEDIIEEEFVQEAIVTNKEMKGPAIKALHLVRPAKLKIEGQEKARQVRRAALKLRIEETMKKEQGRIRME